MEDAQTRMEAAEEVSTNLTGRAVVGGVWTAAAGVGRQLLSLAAVSFLARKLGPHSYGLMGIAGTIMLFLTNLRDLGTSAAVIQRPAISQRMLSTLFWANTVLGLIVAAALAGSAGPLAVYFHEPDLKSILRVLSVSSILVSLGLVHNALLCRRMSFRATSVAELVSAAAGYAISIPMAFSGFGVWSLVAANLAMTACATLIFWLYAGWRPSIEFGGSELNEVARFSLNYAGFGLVNYFARNADNLIVGRYIGAVSLGFYQMAYTLMMYPMQYISGTVAQVTLPGLSKIQNLNSRFRDAYIRSNTLVALITFPVLAGMGVVAAPMTKVILGDKWNQVIPIFQILAPVGMIQSVQTMVGQIYVAKGRTDWMFRVGVGSTVVYVCAFLIGVRWGAVGVAAAYAVAYLLMLYPLWAIPFRLIDLNLGEYLASLWRQIAITATMSAVGVAWLRWCADQWGAALQLASTVVLCTAVYILLTLRMNRSAVAYLAEAISRVDHPLVQRLAMLLGGVEAPLPAVPK